MATKVRTITRWVLAGPITLIAAIMAMAATPLWLPAGQSGVDNIVLPLVLFPAYWALFFMVSILANSVYRATAAVIAISAVHGYLIFTAFSG